jgi:hypothetical protein
VLFWRNASSCGSRFLVIYFAVEKTVKMFCVSQFLTQPFGLGCDMAAPLALNKKLRQKKKLCAVQ